MNKRVWNPYLAGSLAGVLLVLSVLVSGHFLGASTTFARSASVIEKAIGIDPSQFAYFTTSKGTEATPSGWKPGKVTLKPGPDLVGKVWKVWKTEMAFD
jgi:hypothetical protein